MMADHALERRIARLLVVGSHGPRRRAPRVARGLHRHQALLVHRAMALHAPAHGELRPGHGHPREIHRVVGEALPRPRVHLLHGLDAAVTGLTDEPCLDVILVRELRVLRQAEHADPWNGLLLLPVAVELLHLLVALRGHHLVATHTLLHRRDAGGAAAARIRVAVLAADLI